VKWKGQGLGKEGVRGRKTGRPKGNRGGEREMEKVGMTGAGKRRKRRRSRGGRDLAKNNPPL
jgi:hypothetical protein